MGVTTRTWTWRRQRQWINTELLCDAAHPQRLFLFYLVMIKHIGQRRAPVCHELWNSLVNCSSTSTIAPLASIQMLLYLSCKNRRIDQKCIDHCLMTFTSDSVPSTTTSYSNSSGSLTHAKSRILISPVAGYRETPCPYTRRPKRRTYFIFFARGGPFQYQL